MTIPGGPIAGMIVGQAIAGPKVSIDFRNGEWDLDVDSSSVGKVGVYNVGITGAGVFTKTKASGSSAHAFLSSNPKDKKHGSMDLVSGNYAFWVDITKWNVPAYDATKGGIQEAGKASGKLYIRLDTSDGEAQAAGEFTDAVVTYWDDPAKKS